MTMTEISKDEFWHNVNVLPPLLRLGYSNGPGAFMCSEPDEKRTCTVTGKQDYTYTVSVVLRDTDDNEPRFFEHDEHLTINEFMALCEHIMPGVGVCDEDWGKKLLDANGRLRSDLEYPVRRY